jgi:tetratricopeptide (TPR) repeat protein
MMKRVAIFLLLLVLAAPARAAETPEDLLKQAQQLERDGALQRAVKVYQDFLKQFPDHTQATEANYRLGKAFDALGQVEEAVAALKQVTATGKKFKNRPDAFYLLGKLYASDKKYDEAIAAYEKMLGEGAGLYEDEVMNLCGGWYAIQQKYDDAAAKFNLLRRKGDNALAEQAGYKLALLWLKAGRLDAAVAAVQDLAAQFPNNKQIPELLLKAADGFRVQRKFDKTVSICEQLKARYPKNIETLAGSYLLGLCYRDQKEFPKAVAALEAVGRTREFQGRGLVAEALLAAADIYFSDLADPAKAMPRYEEAAKYARDSDSERKSAILEQCYFRLGEFNFTQKNFAAALDYYLLLRASGSTLNVLGRVLACEAALGNQNPAERFTTADAETLKAKIAQNPGTAMAAEAEMFLLDRKLADAVRLRESTVPVAAEYEAMLKKYSKEVLAQDHLGAYLASQAGVAYGQSLNREDLLKAITSFERAASPANGTNNPYRIPALENLALTADRLGDKARATKVYGELFALSKQSLDAKKDDASLEKRTLEYLKSLVTRSDNADLIAQSISLTKQIIEEKGPLSELAAGARFYLAELYYLKKDFSSAAATYRDFIRIYGPKQDANGDVADAPWRPGKADERTEQVFEAAVRIAHSWFMQGHDQNMVRAYDWLARNFSVGNKYLAEANYWLAMELAKGKQAEAKEAKRKLAETLWKNVVNPSLDFEAKNFKKGFHFWVGDSERYGDVQKYVKSAMLKAGQAFGESGEHGLAAAAFETFLSVYPEGADSAKRGKGAGKRAGFSEPDEQACIARYALGREYVALGNTTQLVETFKPYTTGHREDRFRVSALKLLGFHAGRAGQNDISIEAYATLLDEYGENFKDKNGDLVPVPVKDRLRGGNTRWDGIRAELPKDLDPGEIRFALGHLYWKAEDWTRCVKTLAAFLDDVKLAKAKARDRALYMAAQASYKFYDYAGGVRFAQALLREHPKFEAIEEAFVFAARGLVETKAWRDLELISRTFVAEWPKSDKRPRLDLCAALAQIGQGAADKGLAGLKSLAESETYEDVKGDAAYYAGLATLQANPQNQQAALVWFEKSVKVFPREAACLEAARAAMKLEQWAKAREYADRAVREFPKGNPAVIDDARRLLPTVLKELAKQK